MEKYVAAIDAGTNSFHMIIALADTATGKINIVDKEKEMIRLGSGPGNMKYITDEAMSKASLAVSKFKRICDSKKAVIRAVGTSAVREAENSGRFIKKIRTETGVDIEMISGAEEAGLIYKGVINAVPVFNNRILVVDIGGGSTEFIAGDRNGIRYCNSLKMGTIRFAEKYFTKGRCTGAAVKACRRDIEGMLAPVLRDVNLAGYDEVIGTSGTIMNTFNVAEKMRPKYGRPQSGDSFSGREVYRIVRRVIEAGDAKKISDIPGMDKKRADIYLPGIIILEGIFRQFDIQKMRVSDYALREGLIFDTIERMHLLPGSGQDLDLRLKSVAGLAKTFRVDEKHACHTAKLSLEIFDQLKTLHRMGAQEREYLYYAALLHDIGITLSHSHHHIHSYYIIRNADLIGFTENEKEIIANTGRYHRKSHPKLKHPGYFSLAAGDRQAVKKLAAILRIADGLDRMHSSSIQSVSVIRGRKTVRFRLKHKANAPLKTDMWGAETKKFLFEEVFGLKAVFELMPETKD